MKDKSANVANAESVGGQPASDCSLWVAALVGAYRLAWMAATCPFILFLGILFEMGGREFDDALNLVPGWKDM